MHYEVEIRKLAYENHGNGVLRTNGTSWLPIRVLNKDAVPTPLTFDALCSAQAYVERNQPGTVRIVRVTDDGEREVVEAVRS